MIKSNRLSFFGSKSPGHQAAVGAYLEVGI